MKKFRKEGRVTLRNGKETGKSRRRDGKQTDDFFGDNHLYEAWCCFLLIEKALEGDDQATLAQIYPVKAFSKLVKNALEPVCSSEDVSFSGKKYRLKNPAELFRLSFNRLRQLILLSPKLAEIFGVFYGCAEEENRCWDAYKEAHARWLLRQEQKEKKAFRKDPEKWCKKKKLPSSTPDAAFKQFVSKLERTCRLYGEPFKDWTQAIKERKIAAEIVRKTMRAIMCRQQSGSNDTPTKKGPISADHLKERASDFNGERCKKMPPRVDRSAFVLPEKNQLETNRYVGILGISVVHTPEIKHKNKTKSKIANGNILPLRPSTPKFGI